MQDKADQEIVKAKAEIRSECEERLVAERKAMKARMRQVRDR